MIASNTGSKRKFLGIDGPIAIAHRGGAAERPENSMAAFSHAVAMGYRCLETDVRATRDGVVMIFHDELLDRLTSHAGPINAMTHAELRAARMSGSEPIPTLEEVLETFPDVRLVVDPKSDEVVEPLIDVLRRTNALARVCIGSFVRRRLKRVRSALSVTTSCSPYEVFVLRLGSWRLPTVKVPAACAQVPCKYPVMGSFEARVVDAAFIRELHGRGMHVHVWTVDEEVEMERLLDLGVDGIMSDRITLLKSVFVRRGLWHA